MDFKNILVGGDPELLLSTNRKIDNIFYGSGKMIPALGLFGGTKEKPYLCTRNQEMRLRSSTE